MLSIRMLKTCDGCPCGPLGLIFQSCFENGKFPSEWKKANVVPTYKKNYKQIVKNYRPTSLLPICDKIFERLVDNKLFHFFQGNNLISPNQSGFIKNWSQFNIMPPLQYQEPLEVLLKKSFTRN